jgi:hypothetical protein
MTWRAIKRAEFTVSYADISIVKDDIVDECDCVTRYSAPQDVRYISHRINIVRLNQSDAVFKAKSIACKSAVKNIANIGFTQKI